MTTSFESHAMTRLRFLVSAMALVVLFKFISEKTAPQCADCFGHYGFPFAYYNEGGFAGGAGVIWTGLIGDVVAVVVGALLITKAWDLLSHRALRTRDQARG